ncbi:MAG: biopolymer transporter ExbD, partial [Sphingomonadales bacterium]
VPVDLPEATARPLPEDDKPIEITIDQKGAIFLGETPVGYAELVARLRAITENRPDPRIYIRGDESLTYGQIMRVITTINRAGFRKVALVTRRPR